jgi:predicted MPP superfamily phosphohydrolase
VTDLSASRRLLRALVRPPFADELGHKGWWERFARASPHQVREIAITLTGWPRWSRPLRILFLSDLHTGSHSADVARLETIVAQAVELKGDLVLLGGDYVNMQPFGGGRVPPRVIARILARLEAPCGRFAILGNHDISYGAEDVGSALREQGIAVLDDASAPARFENVGFTIAGIPDAHSRRPAAHALVAGLPASDPTIILAHDPVWFAAVRSPLYLTLAGHTHGGQVRLPLIGAITNASKAPLRWTYGHVVEGGRHLYVTSGLGTSGLPIRIGIPPEFVVLDINGE